MNDYDVSNLHIPYGPGWTPRRIDKLDITLCLKFSWKIGLVPLCMKQISSRRNTYRAIMKGQEKLSLLSITAWGPSVQITLCFLFLDDVDDWKVVRHIGWMLFLARFLFCNEHCPNRWRRGDEVDAVSGGA